MRQFSADLWKTFKNLLYKRIILVVTILFCIGVGVAMANMSSLSSNLIKSQALENSTLYAEAIKESRTLYSSEVVSRLASRDGITFTDDYTAKKAGVPLPVTFLIELGKRLGEKHSEISVRLYSEYPFPYRRKEGGPKDNFERQALTYLKDHPQDRFFRLEQFRGKPSFRYAEADIMKASCISCHNTRPDSPKTDWKVGDVRGILEITQPVENITRKTRAGLRQMFFVLASISILGIAGLTLAISRLRQDAKELEKRVRERTAQLQHANEKLSEEQTKSERLLLSILPEPIAEKLKEGHSNIADGFAEVTILFADIVGFTNLSQQISPEELVKFLNEIFSAFDSLTELHGLEKIKTIGDAYMVVGGLPIPREDHAETVAEMALDMQKEIAKFNQHHQVAINIRIGINTGPAIAGVIGTKKFIYDLWGDAVNTASRMESHGIPGMIQVTESTYDRLKNHYQFEQRGTINVKGKGEMTTYLLTGRAICELSV
ncbi:MAG: adenylate/guanylate cyclase domain-containing protein [Actinomycetota bacterium]